MTKRKDTTGHLYTRPNSANWWLQYQVGGQRFRQSLHSADRRAAEQEAARILAPYRKADEAEALRVNVARLQAADEDAARLADEASPPLSLLKAWPAYDESEIRPQSGPLTLAGYEGHWSAFCAWLKEHAPGAAHLRDVSPEIAAAYVRQLAKRGLSGNRINKTARFLKTLFRVLAKPGRLAANPFEEIARRRQLPTSKRPFTIEELKRILESAQGELRTLFMVGTFTGLRLADAATLRWDETDLDRGIIRRVPRKTARTGQAVIVGIPAILGEHLATLRRRGPYVVPATAAEYAANCPALSRRIQAHLQACGIQTVKPGTGVEIVKGKNGKPKERHTGKRAVVMAGFHSLRHTFVSLHAQAGTSQVVLQKLAGHGNPMMTEHYTHIDEGTAKATAAALPAILGEQKALPSRPAPALAEIRAALAKMTTKTWRKVRDGLLKRLPNEGKEGPK